MLQLLQGYLTLAAAHTDTVMPGFTHLQTAQPVTFGHHVMAWFEMGMRDLDDGAMEFTVRRGPSAP